MFNTRYQFVKSTKAYLSSMISPGQLKVYSQINGKKDTI